MTKKSYIALLIIAAMIILILPYSNNVYAAESWLWPAEGCYIISSNFGLRDLDGNGSFEDEHHGIDIRCSSGTLNKPVRAAKSGTIVDGCNTIASGKFINNSMGNYTMINHGDGTYSVYMHMQPGNSISGTVKQGDIIGHIGATGTVYGNNPEHLHFEIFTNRNNRKGTSLNPMPTNSNITIKNAYVLPNGWCSTKTTYIFTVNTTPPTISNVNITYNDSNSYTVTCTVTDNGGGISSVKFPTWTAENDQDDLVWGEGTRSGNTWTYTVRRSDHNNELGYYFTHIYAYSNSGTNTSYGPTTPAAVFKSDAPSITNVIISDVSTDSYKVTCTVIDTGGGISAVRFPTWTGYNGQDDLLWGEGTQDGNTWSFVVKRSDHNNEYGYYYTHIYAYSNFDTNNSWGPSEPVVTLETEPPVISDVLISDVTAEGYTVICTVSDSGSGIDYVQMPSWTIENGQDDLIWHDAVVSGNTATYRVKTSDHNGERGNYVTHIYAHDVCGNAVMYAIPSLYVDNPIGNYDDVMEYNNHKYYLYNTSATWEAAEWYAKQEGAHLVSINDAEENAAIYDFINRNALNCYMIGLKQEPDEGAWYWSDGSDSTYRNWNNGEPSDSAGAENYAAMYSSSSPRYGTAGGWCDEKCMGTCEFGDVGFIIEKTNPPTPTPVPATATPTPIPKATATPVPTAKPTDTSTPKATPVVTSVPTVTATPVPTKTAPTSEPVADTTNQILSFVERIYTYVLNREPETEGAQYWTDELYNFRRTGAEVAQGFIFSEEFVNRNTTDHEFVTILYKTFFGRDPEDEGLNYWLTQLASGTMDRATVANGFIYSQEWADTCASYGIRSGGDIKPNGNIEPTELTYAFVERMYTTAMKRGYDEEGRTYWANELANFNITGEQVGTFFFLSDEMNGYNLSDKEFLNRLYATFMNREADEEGASYWLTVMTDGTPRANVVLGFTRSPEFTQKCVEARILPY